ncbi:hypothetical protein BDZ89DRAFT_1061291, partial [Hymenopellis radicata]
MESGTPASRAEAVLPNERYATLSELILYAHLHWGLSLNGLQIGASIWKASPAPEGFDIL